MGNMNLGVLECEECENTFSCRIGLSNRAEQELSLSCKECGAISLFKISKNKDFSMEGVKKSVGNPLYHMDLHLDFPVFESEEHPLISPFLMAHAMGGQFNVSKHAHDTHLLNEISDNITDVKNTLGFFLRKKYKVFSRKTASYLKLDNVELDELQSEIRLFKYLFELIEPLNSLEKTNSAIDDFLLVIKDLSKNNNSELKSFTTELNNSKFIKNSIDDTVKIYQKILTKEVIFRPSLFLDSIDSNYSKLPFLLSTKDFEYVSDLFKDISEVLSRQLVVVAGVNNLIKRKNHNSFEPVLSAKNKKLEPNSLKNYADLDFGKKLSFIDSSWFTISKDIADNQLRNSTAHYKWSYDPSTQIITYFPKKEGLERQVSLDLSLIDYCKKVIDSFRVLHELNFLLHIVNLSSVNKI